MGGEWNFALVGDPATINVKKYQEELLRIQRKYRYDPKLRNANWFTATTNLKEPLDNIFVKFTYECERCKWHQGEPGVKDSQNAWWVLYWDPTKIQKGIKFWGDTYARCSPRDFIYKSVTMQRHIAVNFPEHFRCYLGDEIDGYGDSELYWGVKPEHLSDSDEEEDTLEDQQEKEWFLETI